MTRVAAGSSWKPSPADFHRLTRLATSRRRGEPNIDPMCTHVTCAVPLGVWPTLLMPVIALVCRRWMMVSEHSWHLFFTRRAPTADALELYTYGEGAQRSARRGSGGSSACLGWAPAISVRGRAALCMPCASLRALALANVTVGFLAFCVLL